MKHPAFLLPLGLLLANTLFGEGYSDAFPYTPTYMWVGVRAPGTQIVFHVAPFPAGTSQANKDIFNAAAAAAIAEWNKHLLNLTLVLGDPVTETPKLGDKINQIILVKNGTVYEEGYGPVGGAGNAAGRCITRLDGSGDDAESDIVIPEDHLEGGGYRPDSKTSFVILHELGHAIGLNHPVDFAQNYPQSVMNEIIKDFCDMPANGNWAVLQASDILYAGTLYGIKPEIKVPPLFSDSLKCILGSLEKINGFDIIGKGGEGSPPYVTSRAEKKLRVDIEFARQFEWRVEGETEWNVVPNPTWSYPGYAWTKWDFLLPLQMGTHSYEFRATNARASSAIQKLTFTRLPVGADTTAPTLTIASPAKDGVSTNLDTAVFAGLITDYGTAYTVEYSLNGGHWTGSNATFSVKQQGASPTSMSTVEWTASIPLIPGVNTISIRAMDEFDNLSEMQTRSIIYTSPAQVTVNQAAGGTITKTFSGTTTLKSGISYTLTATPQAGMVFQEWQLNGASYSRNATLTFTAQDGMNLTPVFIPNPYPAIAGTYLGLFGAGDTADSEFTQHNGLVCLTITKTGKFTGSALIGGRKRPFVGTLDGFKEATLAIRTTKLADIPLTVSLGASANGTIAGLSFEAKTKKIDLVLGRHPVGGASFLGTLGAQGGTPRLAQLKIATKGTASFAGKAPDGKAFTMSSQVNAGTNEWVVPICGFSGKGTLWGELGIVDSTDLSGDIGLSLGNSTTTLQTVGKRK